MSKENPTKYDRYRLKDIEAYREKKRELAKTPEQRKTRTEYMRLWREKNREKHNKQAQESHQRNKHKHVHKVRERHLKSKYGITQADFDKMLEEQNGKCKICSTPQEEAALKRLHVDHDHSTGEIRGLLCSRCNGALGWYEKHKEGIENYLIKNQQ